MGADDQASYTNLSKTDDASLLDIGHFSFYYDNGLKSKSTSGFISKLSDYVFNNQSDIVEGHITHRFEKGEFVYYIAKNINYTQLASPVSRLYKAYK